MIQLGLYGKRTSRYEYLKLLLEKHLDRAKMTVAFDEINDTESFIRDGVQSIPAIRYQGETLEIDDKEIEDYAKEVLVWLLKRENFGKMKKLIVPTDFSEASENALAYAYALGSHWNSVLQIVHVYHPIPNSGIDGGYVDTGQPEIFRQKLEKYTDKVQKEWVGSNKWKPVVDSEFVVGLAEDQIVSMSAQEDSLVVIGTTGSNKGLKRLFGSVSIGVARNSHAPVLMVPPDHEFETPKRIALCIEDQEDCEADLSPLIEFARTFEAEIHLIHIYKEGQIPISLEAMRQRLAEEYTPSLVHSDIIQGDNILESIFAVSRAKEVEVIALLPQERGFLQGLFHSSFTKKIAAETKFPLFFNRP